VFFDQVLADEHYIEVIAAIGYFSLSELIAFFFQGSRLCLIRVISGILLDVNIDEASGLMEFIVFEFLELSLDTYLNELGWF